MSASGEPGGSGSAGDGGSADGRAPGRLRFKVLAVFLVLCIGFCVVEVTLRLTQPYVSLEVITGQAMGPNPMSDWTVADAFSAFHPRPVGNPGTQHPGMFGQDPAAYREPPGNGKTVNSEWFMSTPETPLEKPPGTIRVVYLGGSSTAGTGVLLEDKDTWPWKATGMLRERRGDLSIDFLNGAVGGFTTFESYGRLWSRIRFFSPDVVVVNHAWNEMYYCGATWGTDIRRWRTHPDGDWNIHSQVLRGEMAPHWIDPYIGWSALFTQIRLWTAVSSGEVGRTEGAAPLDTDFDARGIEVFRTNLRLLLAAETELGCRIYVAKQPTLMVEGLSAEDRERCRVVLHGFDHDAHLRAFAAIYGVIDEEVPADRIIDLTPLSGTPELFYDHVHPTPEGTTQIARLVSDHLAPQLVEPDPDRPTPK